MRQKRKWIIISVLAAVVLLAVGIFGVTSFAQTPTPTPTPAPTTAPVKGLMERVANILGVDQTKLEDAFKQAQQEMRDEALDARLDALVKAGKLTQAQADEYKQWIQSRPDVPAGFNGPGPMMKRGMQGFRGPMGGFNFRCYPGANQAPPSPSPAATPTRL